MKQYYIHLNQQEGPFSLEELRAKNISPDTPVWYEGLNDWSIAGKIPELRSVVKATPPPFVSASQQEYEYQLAMEEFFPEKKPIAWTTIFLVALAVGALALLIYKM